MAEPQTIQTTSTDAEPDADTEEEFRALYTDAMQGKERFIVLAQQAEAAGKPEVAAVYREVSAGVLGLIAEMTAATAGALIGLEDSVQELEDEGGGGGGSSLLQEDADKYLSLFDQYMRLLDGLDGIAPSGTEGDKQREIFATLKRLTEGMIEFTKSIGPDPEDDDDDDDEDEDE